MHNETLDQTFHALADPTRRAILVQLGAGEAPVSALAAPFAMALPSFAQHIRVLEAARLITSEKRGRVRWCRLSPAPFAAAAGWMARESAAWSARLGRLETYLDAQTPEKPNAL